MRGRGPSPDLLRPEQNPKTEEGGPSSAHVSLGVCAEGLAGRTCTCVGPVSASALFSALLVEWRRGCVAHALQPQGSALDAGEAGGAGDRPPPVIDVWLSLGVGGFLSPHLSGSSFAKGSSGLVTSAFCLLDSSAQMSEKVHSSDRAHPT